MKQLKQLGSNLHSSLCLLRLLVRRATCHRPRVMRVALSGFLSWSALTTPGSAQGDATDEAQEVALKVLPDHPAVLKETEPWVLADDLGKATVNLRVYFWINGHEHSWLKVRSSVIRLVKRAFQQHGISMPDEAREIIFPNGVPVRLLDGKQRGTQKTEPLKSSDFAPPSEGLDAVSTKAEAGLSNEAGILEKQARQANPVDAGENLLGAATGARPAKADLAAA